jgi:hypothetical protein
MFYIKDSKNISQAVTINLIFAWLRGEVTLNNPNARAGGVAGLAVGRFRACTR